MELRIFGPPGCGKTSALLERILRASKKFGGHNVIVASHTRAAARELADKKDKDGRGISLPWQNYGTLHSLCFRILGHPTLTQKHLKDWNEYTSTYQLSIGSKTASLDDPLDDITNELTPGDLLKHEYDINRAKLIPKEEWNSPLKGFADTWELWKEKEELLDFTDLIDVCLKDVDIFPNNPIVGIFDETQDFTPIQLALIRKWFSSEDQHMLIAGDDDQCIYGFAGTTPDAFLNPEIPDKQKEILSQSYRVPKVVHELADRWIKKIKKRETKEYLPTENDGFLSYINSGYKDPYGFLYEIEDTLKENKTVMILASCSYMLQKFISVMKSEGLPFCNKYRTRRKDWNPLLKPGKGKSTIDRLLAFLLPDYSFPPLWNLRQLSDFTDLMVSKGILKHGAKTKLLNLASNSDFDLQSLLDEDTRTHKQLDSFSDNSIIYEDMRTENYYDFLCSFFEDNLAKELINMINTEIDIDWLYGKMLTNKAKIAEYPIAVYKNNGVSALTDNPNIMIGTIHSVKGGEADHVILFPDLSVAGMETFFNVDTRDEIIRMFYVGMTRTRNKLTIGQPTFGNYVEMI